jgi:hypothetical protein
MKAAVRRVAEIATKTAHAACHARNAVGCKSTDGAINTIATATIAITASHLYLSRSIPAIFCHGETDESRQNECNPRFADQPCIVAPEVTGASSRDTTHKAEQA